MLITQSYVVSRLPIKTKFNFRHARLEDISKISDIYDADMTEEDKEKLIVPPLKMVLQTLENNIKKRRIFVAVDCITEEIVSFVKLFPVFYLNELRRILHSELRSSSLRTDRTLLRHGIHRIFPLNLFAPLNIESLDSKYPIKDEILLTGNTNIALYFYYGSTFTLTEYRGQGINTALINFAFNTYMKSTICILQANNQINQIILMCLMQV